MSYYQKHVFFCTNQKKAGKKCCQDIGATDFFAYAKAALQAQDLFGPDKIRVSTSGCLGRCASGPAIVIYPDNVWYTYQSTADIDEIITTHLIGHSLVERLLLHE